MIKAALALYEATAEKKYLERALAWQAAFDRHYANDHNGGYYLTADDAEGLVVRPDSTLDDATPNPNGIAAQNLIRLAVFTGDNSFRAKADKLIAGVLSEGAENLFARISILNAVDLRIGGAEIVIAGADDGSLTQAALKLPCVSRIVLRAPSADALAAVASGAGESPRHRRAPRPSSASGRPVRCRSRPRTTSRKRSRRRTRRRDEFFALRKSRQNFVHWASRRDKSRAPACAIAALNGDFSRAEGLSHMTSPSFLNHLARWSRRAFPIPPLK